MKSALGNFSVPDLYQNIYFIFVLQAGKKIAYIEK